MPLRYRLCCLAALLCLTLSSTVSIASRPGPTVTPVLDQAIEKLHFGPTSPQATCVIGEKGAPAFSVNYLLPPSDAYYTLLKINDCPGCSGNILQLNTAHFILSFPAACTIPVSVAIVQSDGNSACPSPIPNAKICPPLAYNVTVPAAGTYDIALPLAGGCCVGQDVFLEVNFLQNGTCTTLPRLITTGVCNPCESYNVYPGGFDELCTDIGFPGNPIMNVETVCCLATQGRLGTWGALKLLYR